MSDTISKQAFTRKEIEWLRLTTAKAANVDMDEVAQGIYRKIVSGAHYSPSNQGEAVRQREALEAFADRGAWTEVQHIESLKEYVVWTGGGNTPWMIAREALSGGEQSEK